MNSHPRRRNRASRPAYRPLAPGWLALGAAVFALPLAAQTTAFTGATVWDGTGAPAVENATLVVRDGRVVSVSADAPPSGAAVVDLSGRWVIPGLINAHGHVSGRWSPFEAAAGNVLIEQDLLLWARYGVTTVNSLGGEPIGAALVREGNADPELRRARLHMAGPVVTATDPDSARTAVRVNAAFGVDWIKIRVDDNLGTTTKMPWDVVEAVIDAADEHGLPVATHVFYLSDAKRVLALGADLIAHSVRDTAVDPELGALLLDTDVCYVPTLTREVSAFAYAERPAFFDDPFFLRWADTEEVARLSEPEAMAAVAARPSAARYREALRQAMLNLSALSDVGVRIAMGTDAGPAGRFPGYFEHMELALMAEAGLTPEQVLRSATGVAAACLGLDDVGTLEPGRWADFVVLAADPLADIAATRSLVEAYVAGNAVGAGDPGEPGGR